MVLSNQKVLTAFLDESYTEQAYYIAAVIVDAPSLKKLELELTRLKVKIADDLNISVLAEFHGNELMSGKADWSLIKGDVETAKWVYKSALEAIKDSGAHFMYVAIDVDLLNRRYSKPYDPRLVALTYLLEALDRYALGNQEHIRVVADYITKHNQLQKKINEFHDSGTFGWRQSTLRRIEQPIEFLDSKHTLGLQAADLVAYIVRRHLEAPPTTNARARKLARQLYGTLDGAWRHCRRWP
ncbi:hypothetical protein QFZ23_004259 [Arthrobacter globiformis]|nr:hypothetical protein [Arthrobacter globiformis]